MSHLDECEASRCGHMARIDVVVILVLFVVLVVVLVLLVLLVMLFKRNGSKPDRNES